MVSGRFFDWSQFPESRNLTSLVLTIPISDQGTITDVSAARALPSVMGAPFGFSDIFL
jgi:hypothetical protein